MPCISRNTHHSYPALLFFLPRKKRNPETWERNLCSFISFFSEKFVIFSLCSVLLRNCCVDIESTGYQKPLVIICELDQENLSACSEEWFFVELKLFLSLVFVGCDRLELKKHHSLFFAKSLSDSFVIKKFFLKRIFKTGCSTAAVVFVNRGSCYFWKKYIWKVFRCPWFLRFLAALLIAV